MNALRMASALAVLYAPTLPDVAGALSYAADALRQDGPAAMFRRNATKIKMRD